MGSGHNRAQLLGAHAGHLEGFVVPLQVLAAHQSGPACARRVDQPLAGQAVYEQLLDPDPARHARMQLGLLLGEPHELDQRRHRVKRGPRARVEVRVLGPEALGLLGGPAVGPRDERGDRPSVPIKPDERVHRGAQRHAGDPIAAACLHRGAGGLQRGVDDLIGILFGLTERGLVERIAPIPRTARVGPRVEDDRLDARRPDIDGEDELLVSAGLGHPGQYSGLDRRRRRHEPAATGSRVPVLSR